MRIVSLMPGATETLCLLGLQSNIHGISHECDHPTSISEIPRVTRSALTKGLTSAQINELVTDYAQRGESLYSIDEDRLAAAAPDVILTQDICNVCAVSSHDLTSTLRRLGLSPDVVSLSGMDLKGVLEDIRLIGERTSALEASRTLLNNLRERVESVTHYTQGRKPRRKIVFLEWLDPPFSAGHWTPHLIELAGGRELIGEPNKVSTATTWKQVTDADPEFLVISCCGRSNRQTQVEIEAELVTENLLRIPCVRDGQLYLIDGSAYFNRPGPRLIEGLEVLTRVLHPEFPVAKSPMRDALQLKLC